jgi:hypothetical protein
VFRALERLLFDSLWPELSAFVNAPQPADGPARQSDTDPRAIWRLCRGWLDDTIAGRTPFAGDRLMAPLMLQFTPDGRAWWAVGGIGTMDWERRMRFTVGLLSLPWPRTMLKRCAQCGKYLMRPRRGRAFCSSKCKDAYTVGHRDKAKHARREKLRRLDNARKRWAVVAPNAR